MLKQAQSTVISLSDPKPLIGSLGHFVIFLWALIMVLLPPLAHEIIPTLFMLGVMVMMYPFALQRLASPRWLVILTSLFLINVFFGVSDGTNDWVVLGLHLSSVAVFDGAVMTLHAVVILMAADGLSSSVNIIEVAGLFERGGLRGLGFSIGVATNLLPDLRQSSLIAWHSLRMRGGLRAQWWRGVQLLLLTIISNALRHAEEIVLAVEVRAFRPELSKKVSVRTGILDWWIVIAIGLFFALALII